MSKKETGTEKVGRGLNAIATAYGAGVVAAMLDAYRSDEGVIAIDRRLLGSKAPRANGGTADVTWRVWKLSGLNPSWAARIAAGAPGRAKKAPKKAPTAAELAAAKRAKHAKAERERRARIKAEKAK